LETIVDLPFISNTFTIRRFHAGVVGPGWQCPSHFHRSFELLHCWEGEVTEWLDDQPVSFKGGDWLLIPPGVKHKTLNGGSNHFTYLSLLFDTDETQLRKTLQSLTSFFVNKEQANLTKIPTYINLLDQFILQNLLGSNVNSSAGKLEIQLGFQSCILLILNELIPCIANNKEPLRSSDQKANLYEITVANQIEQWLIQSIHDPTFTITFISNQIGIHRNRILQLFSKVYGCSPKQYVSKKKLLFIKEQLMQTDRSMESIAFEFGFSSLSHFSRQFKRWTGQAPSVYRPKHGVKDAIRMTVKTEEYIYKQVDGAELAIRVYFPPDRDHGSRPAVVFYFGGGWQGGTIEQFAPHSEFLASQGFIAATPEYRIRSKHNTTPFESVEDAKDALHWIWLHSRELGIDPHRIAVAGGSAGGHLAACTAILQGGVSGSPAVHHIPKAVVLFNPVCDTSERGFGSERLGARKLELSPLHNVTEGLPPTIVFHGTADQTVPYDNAVEFVAKLQEHGNTSRLVSYEGRGHGFFNKGRSEGDRDYLDTRDRMHDFLKEMLHSVRGEGITR